MLARQLEPDDNAGAPPGRLKLVGERSVGTREEEPGHGGHLAFVGNALVRIREQVRQQPERYAHLADRLILLGIIIVLVAAAYVFIADPG